MRSRFAVFLVVLAICAVMWLLIASLAFLWLAGLWDNPRIAWSSRPLIWLTYARHGDGSFSEWLYLIVSAVIASAPFVLLLRNISLHPQSANRNVYGKTEFAGRREMEANKIASTRRPF
jgi:hypothetical protein